MRKSFLPVLFVIASVALPFYARSTDNDSLLQVIQALRQTPLDTSHVNKLRVLGHDLVEVDSALSKQLLDEALVKSLQLKDADAITNAYRLLGIWHSYFGHLDSSLKNYRLSMHSAENNKNDFLKAGAMFNMGNIKYWKGAYDSCIYFYIEAAKVFESKEILQNKNITERQLDLRKSDLYANLSAVFNTLKNIKKADEYIDKAIAIAKKYDSPKAAVALAFYMQMKADNFYENNLPEKALRIRLHFLPQLENGAIEKVYVKNSYQSIANEYYDLERFDSARIFVQKSLALSNELHTQDGIMHAKALIGKIALSENQLSLAKQYLEECMGYFEASEDPHEKRGYFGALHQLYNALGRYKDAYHYYDLYASLNDSLLTSEKAIAFAEREIRYETEKKENQLVLQASVIKQKDLLNYLLIGSALALLIISLLGYRNYKHRQRLQQQRIAELETAQQLTATEAVLKGEEQERSRLAKDLHDGLGGMLSGIKYSLHHMKENLIMTPGNAQAFEHSINMLDNSISEMRRVAHNLMPEALLKFGLDDALKDFCNELSRNGMIRIAYQSFGLKDRSVDQSLSVTIYRVTQELLNNIVKHADARQAIVQISVEDSVLTLTVEDDGNGMNTDALKAARGIGWKNITSRVNYHKGTTHIKSEAAKGTSVIIEFPLA